MVAGHWRWYPQWEYQEKISEINKKAWKSGIPESLIFQRRFGNQSPQACVLSVSPCAHLITGSFEESEQKSKAKYTDLMYGLRRS